MRHTGTRRRTLRTRLCAILLATCSTIAQAWELSGSKTILLHPKDGDPIPVGRVTFTPEAGDVRFDISVNYARFGSYFLSMRDFKCIEGGGEATCHVPYPYDRPDRVSRNDLRWLEHALLFLWNQPRDYGAKLDKGVYFRMEITPDGIVGTAQSIDLSHIGGPPDRPDIPPYSAADRGEVSPGSHWIQKLTIR